MKIRLYMDEDAMGWPLVVALRSHGVDVETAREAETVKFPDEQQLKYATEQGRVIYSFNVKDYYFFTHPISGARIITLRHHTHPSTPLFRW